MLSRRETISSSAQNVISDGDCVEITADDASENYSTVGNASRNRTIRRGAVSASVISDETGSTVECSKHDPHPSAKTKSFKNTFNVVKLLRKLGKKSKLIPKKLRPTMTTVAEYQEMAENDNDAKTVVSVRSSRINVGTERSMLVKQNAQVIGRPSVAEGTWDDKTTSPANRFNLLRQQSLILDDSSLGAISDISEDPSLVSGSKRDRTSFRRTRQMFTSYHIDCIEEDEDESQGDGEVTESTSDSEATIERSSAYDFRKLSPLNGGSTSMTSLREYNNKRGITIHNPLETLKEFSRLSIHDRARRRSLSDSEVDFENRGETPKAKSPTNELFPLTPSSNCSNEEQFQHLLDQIKLSSYDSSPLGDPLQNSGLFGKELGAKIIHSFGFSGFVSQNAATDSWPFPRTRSYSDPHVHQTPIDDGVRGPGGNNDSMENKKIRMRNCSLLLDNEMGLNDVQEDIEDGILLGSNQIHVMETYEGQPMNESNSSGRMALANGYSHSSLSRRDKESGLSPLELDSEDAAETGSLSSIKTKNKTGNIPSNITLDDSTDEPLVSDLTCVQPSGSCKPKSRSSLMMRQVSGLGLEDPVLGGSDSLHTKRRAPFIFDDMDLNDVPEDMRDMISLASDHTDVVGIYNGQSSMNEYSHSSSSRLGSVSGLGTRAVAPSTEDISDTISVASDQSDPTDVVEKHEERSMNGFKSSRKKRSSYSRSVKSLRNSLSNPSLNKARTLPHYLSVNNATQKSLTRRYTDANSLHQTPINNGLLGPWNEYSMEKMEVKNCSVLANGTGSLPSGSKIRKRSSQDASLGTPCRRQFSHPMFISDEQTNFSNLKSKSIHPNSIDENEILWDPQRSSDLFDLKPCEAASAKLMEDTIDESSVESKVELPASSLFVGEQESASTKTINNETAASTKPVEEISGAFEVDEASAESQVANRMPLQDPSVRNPSPRRLDAPTMIATAALRPAPAQNLPAIPTESPRDAAEEESDKYYWGIATESTAEDVASSEKSHGKGPEQDEEKIELKNLCSWSSSDSYDDIL